MLWAGRCLIIRSRADALKRRRAGDERRKLRLRQLNANLAWHLWLGGEQSCAPQIRQSRIPPVVITDQVNNPHFAGQRINSRPIRVHGNHLGFRRTRIENATSFYRCAGGPFIDVFIECIDDVVCGTVACRPGHLQILDGPGLEAEPLCRHEISRIVIPGIAKEDPAIRVGETARKEHRRTRAGSSLRGIKPLYSIVNWSRYRTWGCRRDVVRIAAVTEVAEVKAIEESSMVVERPRTKRVIEQAQPGIEIYEGSIITLVPVNPRRPIACLRALLRIIIAGFDAFGFFIGIILRPQKRGEKKQSARQQQTERPDSRTTIHGYSPYRM